MLLFRRHISTHTGFGLQNLLLPANRGVKKWKKQQPSAAAAKLDFIVYAFSPYMAEERVGWLAVWFVRQKRPRHAKLNLVINIPSSYCKHWMCSVCVSTRKWSFLCLPSCGIYDLSASLLDISFLPPSPLCCCWKATQITLIAPSRWWDVPQLVHQQRTHAATRKGWFRPLRHATITHVSAFPLRFPIIR